MTPEQFAALERCVEITEASVLRAAEAGAVELALHLQSLALADRSDLEALRRWRLGGGAG